MNTQAFEFSGDEVVELLNDLDARLRERGARAAVFVVGGAAMAATRARRDRVTRDVDALTHNTAVVEEARAIAVARGLPTNWLNSDAGAWMPPLPDGVLEPPTQAGLRVTYADDGFLLATKLIAQRAKDADDVLALAHRLGLASASADQLEAHIRHYYTDSDALELIVSGPDVDLEVRLLAEDASRMLRNAGQQS